MCGRFALATPVHELASELEAEALSDLTPFKPSWNIAPQTHVPVVTQVGIEGQDDVPKHLRLMRWGFRPSWAKASNREPINARSETMMEKPMFRAAAQRRRGVLPADGWYEWMTTPQGKTPWYHQRTDGQPCLMGVIWDTWTDGHEHMESFALLTQQANEDCRDVHDRMPVIMDHDQMEDWLNRGFLPPAIKSGTIGRHPVDRAVNRVSEDHPGLIRPVPRLFDQEYGA